MYNENDRKWLALLKKSRQATIIYTTRNLDIGFASEGALNILGYHALPEGGTFHDLISDGHNAGLLNLLQEVWDAGKPFRLCAFPLVVLNGGKHAAKFVNLDLLPQRNNAADTAVMMMEMTVIDNLLTSSSSAASFEERLEKWSHTLSHDLRNPLSVAKLGMQYMQSRKTMTPEEIAKWVNMVADAIHNLETLITDTVELNRSDARQSAPASVSQMENMVREIFSKYVAHTAVRQTAIQMDALLPIPLDAVSTHKVFSILNACVLQISQFDPGSKIKVSSESNEQETIYTIAVSKSKVGDFQALIGWTLLQNTLENAGGELASNFKKNDVTTLFLHFPH